MVLHRLPLQQQYTPFLTPDAVCCNITVKRMRFLSEKWVPAYGHCLLEYEFWITDIAALWVTGWLRCQACFQATEKQSVCREEPGRRDIREGSLMGTRQHQRGLSSAWVWYSSSNRLTEGTDGHGVSWIRCTPAGQQQKAIASFPGCWVDLI